MPNISMEISAKEERNSLRKMADDIVVFNEEIKERVTIQKQFIKCDKLKNKRGFYMKITIEAVKVMQVGSGSLWIKNELYLNGSFEGILGIEGKLELESNEFENEILVKGRNKKEVKVKFTATEDVYFWIVDETVFLNVSKPEIYYKGKDLNVIKIS